MVRVDKTPVIDKLSQFGLSDETSGPRRAGHRTTSGQHGMNLVVCMIHQKVLQSYTLHSINCIPSRRFVGDRLTGQLRALSKESRRQRLRIRASYQAKRSPWFLIKTSCTSI
jgi:hypothetical protein